MTVPNSYATRLADEVARLIDQLAEHLTEAHPQQTAQILARVLDGGEGVLGRLTTLVATGSRAARRHAEAGTFPPDLCFALGRAANDLDDLGLDLDEHADGLRRIGDATTPASAQPPKAPSTVARQHR